MNITECKAALDNYGYVVIPKNVVEKVNEFINYWRPLLASRADDKNSAYLFLSTSGKNISTMIGSYASDGFEHYRKRFCLEEKEFSMTRIRKAAQTAFAKELLNRRGDSDNEERIFNQGIGHK